MYVQSMYMKCITNLILDLAQKVYLAMNESTLQMWSVHCLCHDHQGYPITPVFLQVTTTMPLFYFRNEQKHRLPYPLWNHMPPRNNTIL
jgi:hypothetical protein